MDVTLPKLGENVLSADVVRILVAVGDRVEADRTLMELETNKAVVELPSPAAGVVREILVAEGSEVKVGQVLLRLDGASDAKPEPGERPARPEPPTAPAEPRSAAPAPAPREEAPRKDAAQKTEPVAAPSPASPAPAPASTTAAKVPASPSVRRFARELGVDLGRVTGTGPHGRVSMDDVKRHVRQANERCASVPEQPPLPDFAAWGPVRRERMTHIRKVSAEHLMRGWSQVAQVTQFDRADITQLEELRRKYAPRAEQAGGKLTMAVMVVKVAAAALRIHPKFNASIDMASHDIIFKDYVNVGIAVATERGLLVPVLRNVDTKNMVQIAVEVNRLAEQTRKGAVKVDDLQGGTFTVTNLGSIGGTHFTPIVNHPEVAILGMGRSYTEAQWIDGACKPRIVLPLSLSYDHRLIDGAEGARFLRWIVEAIEQPLLLALEG